MDSRLAQRAVWRSIHFLLRVPHSFALRPRLLRIHLPLVGRLAQLIFSNGSATHPSKENREEWRSRKGELKSGADGMEKRKEQWRKCYEATGNVTILSVLVLSLNPCTVCCDFTARYSMLLSPLPL